MCSGPDPKFPGFQIDASCLTWEGQQFQGKAAIVEKLSVSKGQGGAAGSSFPAGCSPPPTLSLAEPSVPENPAQHHGAGPSAHARQLHHQHGCGPA